jgi:hypothetical protein
MATLNIEGRNVQIDDGFLKLSPEDQNKTVDEIASSLGIQKSQAQSDATEATNAQSPGIVEGTGRAFATGVPIVGGVLNKLNAATAATLTPGWLRPYLPENLNDLPEDSWSDRYKHSLAIQNAMDEKFRKEHPAVDTAAGLAGGLAAGGAALKAAPVLAPRLLGLAGETLPSQIVNGVVSGAAINAADAAVRGQDIGQAETTGALLGFAAPIAGRVIGKGLEKGSELISNLRGSSSVPRNITEIAGVPVRESAGQATRDPAAIAREQMALRANDGSRENSVARNFFDAQRNDLTDARNAIASRMSQTGDVLADNPQDAASILLDSLGQRGDAAFQTRQAAAQRLAAQRDELADQFGGGRTLASNPMEAASTISESVSKAAQNAQQAKADAYNSLKSLPGQFHPAAFNGIGDDIKAALNASESPIRIDAQRTPQANAALSDLDEILGNLLQQRDAAGRVLAKPPTTPQVVETARQRLNTFLGDAINSGRSTGSWADASAMRGVIDAFDDQVSSRLKAGTFTGGDASDVLSSMENARTLNTAYRKTFTPQGSGDEVGQAIQKILGRYEGQAAPPEQIRSMLYGSGALPVKIGQRLVGMFGKQSPEISAIKQGMLSHLTEDPGLGPLAPEKAADNIDKFMSQSTLPHIYLSAEERNGLADYSRGLREQAAANAGPSTQTDKLMARLTGADGSAPPSTTDLVQYLNTTKGISRPVQLAQRLKTEFGQESHEFSALKQGQWSFLTENNGGPLNVGSRAVTKRIDDFLNGSGKPLSHVMFNADERSLIREYGALMEKITPPPGTVNYSNTASTLGKIFKGTIDGLFAAGGMSMVGPVGAAAGVAAHQGQKIIQDAVRASKLARSLYGTPQSSKAMQNLQQSLYRISSLTARSAAPMLVPN